MRQGPFPPLALPNFIGLTDPSAICMGRLGPSRVSRCRPDAIRKAPAQTSLVAHKLSHVRAVTITPAGRSSAFLARFLNRRGLPRYYGESTPTRTFSGPAQCSSPYSPHVALLSKCFRPFVTSWPAPSASGRSESGRAGISPTELVRLRQGTHNNRVENDIRPFAVGRRSWLFIDTQLGARASASRYSLAITYGPTGSTLWLTSPTSTSIRRSLPRLRSSKRSFHGT
jgi:Transposase IS66 family